MCGLTPPRPAASFSRALDLLPPTPLPEATTAYMPEIEAALTKYLPLFERVAAANGSEGHLVRSTPEPSYFRCCFVEKLTVVCGAVS